MATLSLSAAWAGFCAAPSVAAIKARMLKTRVSMGSSLELIPSPEIAARVVGITIGIVRHPFMRHPFIAHRRLPRYIQYKLQRPPLRCAPAALSREGSMIKRLGIRILMAVAALAALAMTQ